MRVCDIQLTGAVTPFGRGSVGLVPVVGVPMVPSSVTPSSVTPSSVTPGGAVTSVGF